MRRLAAVVVLFAGLAGATPAQQKQPETPEAVAKWRDSVALVQVVREKRAALKKANGWRVTMEEVKGAKGVHVTFFKGERIDEKAFNYVRVSVYKNEYADLVAKEQIARRDAFLKKMNHSLPKFSPSEKAPKELQERLDRSSRGLEFKWLYYKQLGLTLDVSELVKKPELALKSEQVKVVGDRIHFSTPWIDAKKKRYAESLQTSSPDGDFVWERYNLDGKDDAHAVHVAAHGRILVIVHFRFLQRHREALLAGKPVDRAFLERLVIARSVSLY
jgi:hypothetical protein